jgi:cytidine deaminase
MKKSRKHPVRSTSPSALLRAAAKAAKNAYSPHSLFRVGAAVASEDGRVFTGCNVENASYGLTVCAERSAVSAAIAAGVRRLAAVAVVADGKTPVFGACRQVLAEFAGDDTPVHIAALRKPIPRQTVSLGSLLPNAFRFRKASSS